MNIVEVNNLTELLFKKKFYNLPSNVEKDFLNEINEIMSSIMDKLKQTIDIYEHKYQEYIKEQKYLRQQSEKEELKKKFPKLSSLISDLRVKYKIDGEFRSYSACEYFYCAMDEVDDEHPTYCEIEFRLYFKEQNILHFGYSATQENDTGSDKVYLYPPRDDEESYILEIDFDKLYEEKVDIKEFFEMVYYLTQKYFVDYEYGNGKHLRFCMDCEMEKSIKNYIEDAPNIAEDLNCDEKELIEYFNKTKDFRFDRK